MPTNGRKKGELAMSKLPVSVKTLFNVLITGTCNRYIEKLTFPRLANNKEKFPKGLSKKDK
ncbi:hypothetical protein EKTHUN627_19320 [Enterobacter kobei]|nr:hypothetical protein EKTHUN627_19320 [Enterobacter kobei]